MRWGEWGGWWLGGRLELCIFCQVRKAYSSWFPNKGPIQFEAAANVARDVYQNAIKIRHLKEIFLFQPVWMPLFASICLTLHQLFSELR